MIIIVSSDEVTCARHRFGELGEQAHVSRLRALLK